MNGQESQSFCPKCGSADGRWEFECGSELCVDEGNEVLIQSELCIALCLIAALEAQLAEQKAEAERLRMNGCCPACHSDLNGVGYRNAWRDPDPEVVFQCKCGRNWTAEPALRRSEYLKTGVQHALANAEPQEGAK